MLYGGMTPALGDVAEMLKVIQIQAKLSIADVAELLDSSRVSVDRWARGASEPSPAQVVRIRALYETVLRNGFGSRPAQGAGESFRSHGINRLRTLFDPQPLSVRLLDTPLPSIAKRMAIGDLRRVVQDRLCNLVDKHRLAAETVNAPPVMGMSAGKNTYTYDAHTYHTKVPPQGIAELLVHYLPAGEGLVLDPFAGSGMTGVAARFKGYDCILNELSPAACFIADRFTSYVAPELFEAGLEAILSETNQIRRQLYTTHCRECGKGAEILYIVWSYNVVCSHCRHEFPLWDHCRYYGKRVRDHKILTEFPCPACQQILQKSRLERTKAIPVILGYKCCSPGRQETTHPLNDDDWIVVDQLEQTSPLKEGFYPDVVLPDGVNLRQPIKHGLVNVAQFYTPRNLAAMSHLWEAIHRIEDTNLAAHMAFVFTSLYQRVTRLSEFRFWGGSGNTARFNVPFIFNEANVFVTFERKARSILDHLRATAVHYRGDCLVINRSVTQMDYLPDESIDFIFTDPPFGANINYSEMNILWESWLGAFTDSTEEAIINRVQGKDIDAYHQLMTSAMKECFRVLRTNHWMLLMFMNSSKETWDALRSSIIDAGFMIRSIDIFDKQHGTFKQFASDNTAGFDLVLHCLKPEETAANVELGGALPEQDIIQFVIKRKNTLPIQTYLHVERGDEVDYRKLYSDWLAEALTSQSTLVDFAAFRETVSRLLASENGINLSKPS